MRYWRSIALVILVVGLVIAALLWLPIGDSTRIRNEVVIARAPDAVFAYVSTPGNWPKWHPASKAVSGASDHSLAAGERVTEDFVVAGRTGRVVWTVLKRDPPREWVIEGDVEGRKAGLIIYSLTPVDGGTRFERDFTYPSPNLLF